MKCLSGVVNQTLPMGMVYRFVFAVHSARRGLLCTLPSQRHGTHSETCRICRLSGRKRKSLGHCQTVAIDPQRTSKTGHTRRTIGSAPDDATGTTEAAIEDRETAKAERRWKNSVGRLRCSRCAITKFPMATIELRRFPF
jgi:hypothetical protein